MLVEFLGASGAGKSTLARSVGGLLEPNISLHSFGPSPKSRPARARRVLRLRPSWLIAIAQTAQGHREARYHLIKAGRRDQQLRQRVFASSTWLLPDGPLHPATTALSMLPDPEAVARRIATVSVQPDVVVTINCDPSQAVKRVLARGATHRYTQLTPSEAVQQVKRYYEAQQHLLREVRPSHVIEVDSTVDSVRAASERVWQVLYELL